MKKYVVWAVAVVAIAGIAVAGGYDSQGFEPPTFMTGALNGQDGWEAGFQGDGIEPMVVTAPDPVIGTQAVRLEVTNNQGSVSWMQHAVDLTSVVSSGGTVEVSYDVYRQLNSEGKLQNIWWYWYDAGTPSYGLQWDQGPGTYPHGWNPGAGSAPTVLGRYANVRMVWDFGTNLAYSWYDGVQIDNGIPITDFTTLTGWAIYLGHESDTGTGADVAWIDNFYITPEPASALLFGLAALILRRR
jgi:hypothetical protein